MPVTISFETYKSMLLAVGNKHIKGLEVVETNGTTVTYGVEVGYHQSNALFTAEILVEATPTNTVINLTPIGSTDPSKLLEIAEQFCAEKIDCVFNLLPRQ